MLALGCQFISPSQHVADAFIVCTVQGVAGLSIMALIWQPSDSGGLASGARNPGQAENRGVAHDLRYDGKTNQQLVREMRRWATKSNCIPLVSSRRSPLQRG